MVDIQELLKQLALSNQANHTIGYNQNNKNFNDVYTPPNPAIDKIINTGSLVPYSEDYARNDFSGIKKKIADTKISAPSQKDTDVSNAIDTNGFYNEPNNPINRANIMQQYNQYISSQPRNTTTSIPFNLDQKLSDAKTMDGQDFIKNYHPNEYNKMENEYNQEWSNTMPKPDFYNRVMDNTIDNNYAGVGRGIQQHMDMLQAAKDQTGNNNE